MGSPSHAKILKSTSLIGGATAVGLIIRIVRSKILAILLGPMGVGLESMYFSIIQLSQTICSFGISSAGVGQIAAAAGTGDKTVLDRTVRIIRWTSIALGCTGAALLFFLRTPVSILTFGSENRAGTVGLLSITVFFGTIIGGQGAVLQGLRRIADLAKVQVLGVLAGAVCSIPIVWIWGLEGIPAYLIVGFALNVVVSWIYARQIRTNRVRLDLGNVRSEVARLLGLGLALLSSSFMSLGAIAILRVVISRRLGLGAVGQYQSATSLAVVYAGVILQSMSADFYPRLSAVATHDSEVNDLVNEQTEVCLLLTIPGIVGTIALAPFVVHLFLSPKFLPAADVLVWQAAGVLLQVSSNAMGFIVVAKGRAALHFATEIIAWSAYLIFALVGLRWFGLPGLGMAYLAMYAFYWVVIYSVVRRLTGFRWSSTNVLLNVLGCTLAGLCLAVRWYFSDWGAVLLGLVLVPVAAWFCFARLLRLVGSEKINQYFRKLNLPLGIPRWLSRCCGDVSR